MNRELVGKFLDGQLSPKAFQACVAGEVAEHVHLLARGISAPIFLSGDEQICVQPASIDVLLSALSSAEIERATFDYVADALSLDPSCSFQDASLKDLVQDLADKVIEPIEASLLIKRI